MTFFLFSALFILIFVCVCVHSKCLYTGGAAIAVPLPVLLILSLPMAGQREELYSLKGATLPYRYAHPDTVVVDQQLLH